MMGRASRANKSWIAERLTMAGIDADRIDLEAIHKDILASRAQLDLLRAELARVGQAEFLRIEL